MIQKFSFDAESGNDEKYVFVKPFSIEVLTGGGALSTRTYSYQIGDVVKGKIIPDRLSGEPFLYVLVNPTPVQGGDSHINIPMSYVSKKIDKKKELIKYKDFKNSLKSPIKEGYKKFVVTEGFIAYHNTDRLKTRQFKKGMNLFAKETIIAKQDGSDSANLVLVSYAGFIIDKSKVVEKKPNIYEKIQNFFTIKKGFTQ